MASNSAHSRPIGWIAPAALGCAALAFALLWFSGSSGRESTPVGAESAVLATVLTTHAHATSGPQAVVPHAVVGRASDGVPIAPADTPIFRPDGPMHPHPITPAHTRIFRENALVGSLDRAVDMEDAAGIRALLAQYRAEFPEDDHVLQEGYALVADCLAGPDGELRARAERFWRTQIRSQTRRYVRRHCLER